MKKNTPACDAGVFFSTALNSIDDGGQPIPVKFPSRFKLIEVKAVDTVKRSVSTGSLEHLSRKRELSKRQALDRTLQILSDNPGTGPSEIASQIGKSRQTVYDHFDELGAAGKLHRNGSMNVIK